MERFQMIPVDWKQEVNSGRPSPSLKFYWPDFVPLVTLQLYKSITLLPPFLLKDESHHPYIWERSLSTKHKQMSLLGIYWHNWGCHFSLDTIEMGGVHYEGTNTKLEKTLRLPHNCSKSNFQSEHCTNIYFTAINTITNCHKTIMILIIVVTGSSFTFLLLQSSVWSRWRRDDWCLWFRTAQTQLTHCVFSSISGKWANIRVFGV